MNLFITSIIPVELFTIRMRCIPEIEWDLMTGDAAQDTLVNVGFETGVGQ